MTATSQLEIAVCQRPLFPFHSSIIMISRPSLGRSAQSALRRQCQQQPSNRRGLAAVASGTFNYETGDAAGVKFASRDLAGPTTTVAVVAKAGTRYQVLPGFSDGLEKFAFKVRLQLKQECQEITSGCRRQLANWYRARPNGLL